jgi:hypothetical protein
MRKHLRICGGWDGLGGLAHDSDAYHDPDDQSEKCQGAPAATHKTIVIILEKTADKRFGRPAEKIRTVIEYRMMNRPDTRIRSMGNGN